jgi:hypothetical protein
MSPFSARPLISDELYGSIYVKVGLRKQNGRMRTELIPLEIGNSSGLL